MISRQPYHGARRKLVLAFDVGTTYSGISYSILDPGEVPEIKGVTRHDVFILRLGPAHFRLGFQPRTMWVAIRKYHPFSITIGMESYVLSVPKLCKKVLSNRQKKKDGRN